MPQPIRSFDRMIIPAPCGADWESMTGNDQVRFCEHCKLHVTNLSSLTRQDAIRLVARSQGRICVRFVQRPSGGVLTKQMPEKLHEVGRRVSRLAAGAFSATLSLSSAAAQTESIISREKTEVVQSRAQNKANSTAGNSTIFGRIVDPNEAVVPGAAITLINAETNAESHTTSSDEGEYVFQTIATGTYKLRIRAPGFKILEITSIEAGPDSSQRLDGSLEVGAVAMGVMVMVEPEEPLIKAAFADLLEAVKEFVFSSLDINTIDKNTHMTALEHAVENGNLEIVRTLLLAGASANAPGESGRTALMYLRENAIPELVRELISAGAKVNARDESGGTALMNAAAENKYEVVKELIEAGAKIDLKDAEGKTALVFAVTNQDSRVTKLFIDAERTSMRKIMMVRPP